MALDFLQYCKKMRAKAETISLLFGEAQNIGLKNQGTYGSPTATTGGALKNPKAYDAGFTYMVTTNSSVTDIIGPVGIGTGGNWNNAYMPRLYQYFPNFTSLTDNLACNDIVGLLTPVKLSDYMAQNNINSVTRLYTSLVGGGGILEYSTLVNSETLIPVDDSILFSDWIVPVIEWFFTNNSGVRKKLSSLPFFYYFYSTTAFETIKYSTQNLFGGTFHTYSPNTMPIGGDGVGYFGFSPPYIHASSIKFSQGACCQGFMSSGVVYENYPEPDRNKRLLYYTKTSAPYVVLSNNPKTAVPDGLTYNIQAIDVEGYSSPVGIKSYDGRVDNPNIVVYRSAQAVIDLFADYGVMVTTDLDVAMNPPETDDGIINPGNPSDPLPFFPDNDSDETPIEQAYITPSTFAQSCVYNPLTTRDFLRWICDNTVDVKNWSRLFANPVDVITGINLYNLDIPAHDSAHTLLQSETNILGVTTSIPNYAILDGYNNIVDGGTLTLEAYYGNYADFTSMTYQIFIPFVGFTSLRPCDVVNKRLHLFYAVDFATGAAVAFLNSDNKLIYTSPCTVAGKIPLSTSDKNSQMINNTLSILGSVGGLLGGIASGNVGGGVGALLNGFGGLQMQTNYTNKGSLSVVNIYKLLPAFVERTRYDLFFPSDDQQYIGARYQSAAGAPSTTFDTLINCANAGGFVQSDVVYITSGTATETEKAEIAALIKSGIYL